MENGKNIFENEYFRQTIDALPIAIYTTNAEARLTYYNSAAVDLSGREPELGSDQWYLTWKLFYSDGSPMQHDECPMAVALREDRRIKESEGIIERSDGSRLWFEAYASPLHDDEGNIFGGINMLLNITERKKIQQQLQELNETLEERVEERTKTLKGYQDHLRNLVHQLSEAEEQERHRLASELHDNLGQILTIGKMKVNTLQDSESVQEKNELDDLKNLIDDALNYTRELMSDLKPPPTLDEEDLRASIKWVADKMGKHDLEVSIEDDGKSKRTRKEVRIVLVQSVRELLFNVIKHAGVDRARVSMACKNGEAEIIVRDNGEGFDPSSLNQVNLEEGGFGLYHVQERMDALDGRMNITSEPGEGTKVTLWAPLEDEEESEPSIEWKETTPPLEEGGETIRVLLVDDHKMMLKGLCKIVDAQEDMEVIGEATNGKEAVELARETSPEIVIMDVNLPKINGIEATRQIKTQLPTARIIGISFHRNQDVIDDMRSAGASAYLKKDEAFETLSETIRAEASASRK